MSQHAHRSCRLPTVFQARSAPGSSVSQKPAAPFLPVCRSRGCRYSSKYHQGYIRRKADASISSKDFYAVYRLWCEENSLAPLKSHSFSDAMVANAKKFDLEHFNNITNSAGWRIWGFMGVKAVARPNINGFYDIPPCTYVPNDIPEEWRRGE